MSDLLISIIINNYNYDRFLAIAIDSALNQTYPHVEVIVVDDCSTDNSRQIIANYGDRIIPVLHETNGKQGAAFNSGFAKSQGEFILFLDSDDYLHPQAAERIVATWKPGVGKVHYRLDVVDSDGKELGITYPQGGGRLPSGNVLPMLLSTSNYVSNPTSGNAYRREALKHVFPIPQEFNTSSDDYLFVSMPFLGELAAIEEPLGVYRLHTSNQWAIATVDGSRFRRFVNHDLQNYALLVQRATDAGYTVPEDLEIRSFGRLWSRLASLRLDPENHPVLSDRPLILAWWGIRALWKYTTMKWHRRLAFSLWFLWVATMPLPLAKLAITWLLAPKFRPKPIRWMLNTLRGFANRFKPTVNETS